MNQEQVFHTLCLGPLGRVHLFTGIRFLLLVSLFALGFWGIFLYINSAIVQEREREQKISTYECCFLTLVFFNSTV